MAFGEPIPSDSKQALAEVRRGVRMLETMSSGVPWRGGITDEQIRFEEGRMFIPDKSGLGIDLNLEAIAAHPYEPRDLRHYKGTLTDIRPADARS